MWWLVACAAERAPLSGSSPRNYPNDTGEDVARAPLQLRFPLADRTLFEQTVGVDHDPVVYDEGLAGVQCTSYDGRSFPWCYDEHSGSDHLLIGGFDQMDAGSPEVVAAASGVVVEAVDGNYDRCSATFEGVDCDGYPMAPNYVIVEHEGGALTSYYHLLNGSVAVQPGDAVACGDPLGKVGSSGYSSMPHLHFGLRDATHAVIDPYAGAYSQPETWWVEQGENEGLPGSDCPA